MLESTKKPGAVLFEEETAAYRKQFNSLLDGALEAMRQDSKLYEACRYTMLSGGKRFRPILVLMVADALGNKLGAESAALAVEYFHTASLIADDLPCMDDDDERRSQPSAHKVYGEAVALLASYSLISAAYGEIARSGRYLTEKGLPGDRICTLALESVTRNTGLEGVTGGQFLDIYATEHSLDRLRQVVRQKTGTLFEISFVLGWLFGGGSVDQLEVVCSTAQHYGMAFQIADDFDDVSQDAINGRGYNFVALLGVDVAYAEFSREIAAFQAGLKTLGLEGSKLNLLAEILIGALGDLKSGVSS